MRYSMVIDLTKCVGCNSCTAACKHANATPPDVQWRRVLDMEVGEYPAVKRVFVPVGCMHCEDPPCMHVCPSTATRKRADGIVTIDYDLCIGCSYCAVACPYDARFKVDRAQFAYGSSMKNEEQTFHEERIGVATKCTFCAGRIDAGLAERGWHSRMLLQVHDELVFEAPPDEAGALARFAKETMETVRRLEVPLIVDVGIGENWRDAK